MIKQNDFSDRIEIGISIYKAKCNDEIFVLKELKESETTQETLKIIMILQNFPHPNVVKFYDLINDSLGNIVLVMKYAEGGNLRQHLNASLKIIKKLKIAKDVVEGLKFLHNNNIVHCDMHTANILVHEGRMMIADFDFSKFSNSEGEAHGIAAFVDPCALQFSYNDKVIFTTKYDIYALGVILWEIASCRRPFDGKTPIEIMVLTQNGVRETASEMLLEYDSLYMSCWDEKPEKRPEANSILETLNDIIEKY
ncbi:kinase-like domain-containing protein [Gigaspora rosea]|uniref:Kinase-like domain-containing protein n=1 Tax=Gigaspora rosea TaxID=44941 RepID=A0A397UFE4_9GLOM|nr:kinase-like domain-containing protein [Gigaspora rosea]